PWPHLDELEARTATAGFDLVPRLPVYPDLATPDWIDPGLWPRVQEASDERGYASLPSMEKSAL
ncbi:MAG: hypothetical protein WD313_06925, partial [Acidimicrobiia bacterium]